MKNILFSTILTLSIVVCYSQTYNNRRTFINDDADLYKKIEGSWIAHLNDKDTFKIVLSLQPTHVIDSLGSFTIVDISGWHEYKKGDSVLQSSFDKIFKLDTIQCMKPIMKSTTISIFKVYKKPFYYSGIIYDITKNKGLSLYIKISNDGTKMDWELRDIQFIITDTNYDSSFVLPPRLFFTRQSGL